jgi:hypothetical protein
LGAVSVGGCARSLLNQLWHGLPEERSKDALRGYWRARQRERESLPKQRLGGVQK